MDRLLLLWLACLLASAVTASSDVYRCEEPDGGVRFVDDPSHCPAARRLQLGPREQEAGTDSPPAGSAQGEAGAPPEERLGPDLPLEEILLPAARVAGRWEVVDEAPTDPAGDPDLVRWGVRAQRARHYTRSDDAGVRVCSIEIWGFEDARRARLAHENIRYPSWHFERQEHLLIMLHAVTFPRAGSPHNDVFVECRRLGARTSARAANRLRR
jgi:hypothetical protein